jgi:hypothetical protein
MSLNGHFTHYQAIPADLRGGLTAQRIYTPTVTSPPYAYFKGNVAYSYSDSAALAYSVGCHSGLSVIDGDLSTSSKPGYKADFASAVLKQGGNWIGNTGYGYGDSDLVAYSEKLSVLFTKAIGRRITDLSSIYIGPTIGESLVRAKREYLRGAGPSSFGPYDEKIIEEWTLYGLPFIRVKVPNPTNAPFPGNAFDPAALPVPPDTRANLGPSNPTFTRLITVSNITYGSLDLSSDDVPRVLSAKVEDNFGPANPLTIDTLIRAGQPVLPLLSYDITLRNTGNSFPGTGQGIPQPRGVRLLSATMLPEIAGYNPHVTTITTDTTFVQQQTDPDIGTRGQWLPDQPFTYQRTAAAQSFTDKLLISPAQFWGTSERSGRLRRFKTMVFEVSYIDPQSALIGTLNDTTPPEISNVSITLPSGGFTTAGAQPPISVQALVNDDGSGTFDVVAVYSSDGTTWDDIPLTPGAGGKYTGLLNAPSSGKNISVLVTASDKAGNVSTYTAKGALLAYTYMFMPAIRR